MTYELPCLFLTGAEQKHIHSRTPFEQSDRSASSRLTIGSEKDGGHQQRLF